MRRRVWKLAPCILAAGMMLSVPVQAEEAETAPVETEAETVEGSEDTGTPVETETAADQETSEQAETESKDRTGELVFAQCEEYVNVRSGADTDCEVVAKMYNYDSATIIGQEGDWYKIQSGNAVGYVKAEYIATDEEAEAIAAEVAYNVAAVHPEELNIRTNPTEEADVLGIAHQSEELEVVDYSGDWMKVALGDDVYGYVNAYYVEYKTYYPTAETLEEEQERLRSEQEAAQWAESQPAESWEETSEESWTSTETQPEETWVEPEVQPETQPEETWTQTEDQPETQPEQAWTETETQPETQPEQTWTETEAQPETQPEQTWTETEAQPETQPETEAPSSDSSTGQAIADYAVQFVGNPYVWGGTSLTNGADCSGFTQSVFANFGISLSRTAAAQSGNGTAVSLDSLQAGDLVFYSSGSGIDHVAIYIGGGQIVHAANSNSGIIISNCYYSTPVCAVSCW